MRTCEKCGRPIADSAAACPYCGYSQTEEVPNALQPGWEIAGRYRIESVIGIGGFGITYRAYDKKACVYDCTEGIFPIRHYQPHSRQQGGHPLCGKTDGRISAGLCALSERGTEYDAVPFGPEYRAGAGIF